MFRFQSFPQKPPCSHTVGSRAQGFNTPIGRRRSSCPPPSPNLVRTHPIIESALEPYQAFRDNALCLSRATTFRRVPTWSLEEAHLVYITFNQPYRPRVSTDRLNREDRQLAASLECEPGPTPARTTLSHSYLETRFRWERARGTSIL